MVNSQLTQIGASKKAKFVVNCFPLNSIATALNITHVDYFSLDVEGPEVEILQSVDWTRLSIDVITVEYNVNAGSTKASLKRLETPRKLVRDTGIYREVGKLPNVSDAMAQDVVFSRV